jgi:hypothetical protein
MSSPAPSQSFLIVTRVQRVRGRQLRRIMLPFAPTVFVRRSRGVPSLTMVDRGLSAFSGNMAFLGGRRNATEAW